MKQLTIVLFVALVALCSCSQDIMLTESGGAETSQAPAGKIRLVHLGISGTDEADVKSVAIYVYVSERKKDSLVCSMTVNPADGDIRLELPLGESLKAFAVANAGEITGADSLATVTVNMNAAASGEVYLSDIVSFSSDYTAPDVQLTLSRMVGEIVVRPKEENLADAGFDRAAVTLSNVGLACRVSTREVTTGDVTLQTGAAGQWTVRAYSFPTADAGASAKLNMTFFDGEEIVNTSAAAIDLETTIEASKRYNVTIPYLDEDYLSKPWTRATGAQEPIVSITNM